MDRIIALMPGRPDGDLFVCDGVAYQRDMKVTAEYGLDYLQKLQGYEGSGISEALNAARIGLVARHYGAGPLLDVGIGSGEFVRRRGGKTFGVDVNPIAAAWLQNRGLWGVGRVVGAWSFWDVIEHLVDPGEYLDQIPVGGWVFVSIPVFEDLSAVRESKHYRPGEHLYYWTADGFVRWMAVRGFRLAERNRLEQVAGRDSIESFALVKAAHG